MLQTFPEPSTDQSQHEVKNEYFPCRRCIPLLPCYCVTAREEAIDMPRYVLDKGYVDDHKHWKTERSNEEECIFSMPHSKMKGFYDEMINIIMQTMC